MITKKHSAGILFMSVSYNFRRVMLCKFFFSVIDNCIGVSDLDDFLYVCFNYCHANFLMYFWFVFCL